MWNLKYNTKEFIYQTKTDTQRSELWLPRWRGMREAWMGSLELAGANLYIE